MKKQLLALSLLAGLLVTAPAVEAVENGWYKSGNTWSYSDQGVIVKDNWQYSGNNWYYFDANGQMVVGWYQIAGDWYYMNPDGSCAINRWQDGCYLNASGRVVESFWVKDGNDWYYQVDGQYLTNTWVGEYYLREDGRLARNTWVDNYRVDGTGRCQYNKFVGDYYVGSSGKVVFNQWVMDGGNWYYVGRDGKYLRDTDFYVGSTRYIFASNGQIAATENITRTATIGGMTVNVEATTATKYSNESIVWEYTPIANYYAVERASTLGGKVYQLRESEIITINNRQYRIAERKTGLTFKDKAGVKQYLATGGYNAILQTCDDTFPYIVIYKLVLE